MTSEQGGPIPPEASQGARPARRWGVFAVAVGHALVFATAAILLPWRDYALFAVMTLALALGHGLTAAAALARPRELARVWRASAWLSLLWLVTLTWSVLTSAMYVARIYGTLGSGIAVALLIGWCIPILFTVPFAAWALNEARPPKSMPAERPKSKRRLVPPVLGVVLMALLSWQKLAAAHSIGLDAAAEASKELTRLIEHHLPDYASLPAGDEPPAPLTLEFSTCPAPVEKAKATLFFQYRSAKRDAGEVRSECVQAASVREVLAHAGAALKREALRAPIKLDLVERHAALSATDPLLDGFKLRPGLDGVCAAERCLLGWQLAAREMVNENTPISAIPELRMGFSPARVRRALGQAPEHGLDGLTRIETRSFIYDGQLTELLRMHRAAQELSRASVKRAGKLAERHIVRALGDDGRYRYQHHPFRGHSDTAGYNLPRQAGTTLVLCELGAGTETAPAIERALEQMASLEVRVGEKSLLVYPEDEQQPALGSQALPLIAFLSCRERVGERFDPLIGRLAASLLALQREEGDFHPAWDLKRYQPHAGSPPLFSPGQAVMALVLLERLVSEKPGRHLPEHTRVSEATERAMRFYGERYWDFPLGKLFYVEENWHCLAARAALTHHRVDAYERFCIEHVEFKARFIVGDESPTPDMRGAFALAPLIPPPNTATAGVGEALAAAIAVKRARHEDTAWAEAQLARIMTFLLRQQWDRTSCFACQRPELVIGGFSDSMLTPTLRIDFTQHAWAAIGHGSRVLHLGYPRFL